MDFKIINNQSVLEKSNKFPHNSADSINFKQLVLIDSRASLREALSKSLRENFNRRMIEINNVVDLLQHRTKLLDSGCVVIYGYGVHSRETDINTIRQLQETLPTCSIVLLTNTLDHHIYDIFTEYSLSGIIPSSFTTDQLVACLQMIDSGVPFLPSDSIERHMSGSGLHFGTGGFRDPDLSRKLTPRQQEVMKYITIGKSNKYIAAELDLCESTVKVHVSELMRRLGATSRTHASYIMNKHAHSLSDYQAEKSSQKKPGAKDP